MGLKCFEQIIPSIDPGLTQYKVNKKEDPDCQYWEINNAFALFY